MKIMKVLCVVFSLLIFSQNIYSKQTASASVQANNSIFQIRLYHLKDDNQVTMTDNFLKDAYLPALHRYGIKNIGVFKPISNDTASDKVIYVLIPFSSLDLPLCGFCVLRGESPSGRPSPVAWC